MNNKVVYMITVIKSDEGYCINGSTEYVDEINNKEFNCYGYRKRSDGYTTLIIWNSGTNATVTIGCNTGGGSYTSGTILHYNNNYYKWEYTVSQYE